MSLSSTQRVAALALACSLAIALPASARQYLNSDSTISDGVKIETGTAGSPVGSTNPLTTGGVTTTVCVTPTITASTYAVKQPIGGLLTFANAFRASPGTGILQNITVTSKSVQTAGLTFYPFATAPTTSAFTDHTTAAIAAVDVASERAPIPLATAYSDLGTHTAWGAYGIGQAHAAGAANFYGVLVAQATTAAFASTSDVQVCATFLQD